MSNTFSIRNNFPKIAAKLDNLAKDVGKKAMVRALNKTIGQGQTQMARSISKEFKVSLSDVKYRLNVRRAFLKKAGGSQFSFEATLEATRRRKGRSMNLIAFVTARKVSKASAKRQGNAGLAGQLQLKIKRNEGNKVITGAFIGNKGRTLFIRTGKGRLPIKPLNTIDIPQMFNTKRINSVVRTLMIKNFSANFDHELNAILKGFAR